jgi:hypothetical protein
MDREYRPGYGDWFESPGLSALPGDSTIICSRSAGGSLLQGLIRGRAFRSAQLRGGQRGYGALHLVRREADQTSALDPRGLDELVEGNFRTTPR